MKHTAPEYLCLALLWTGTAGAVASVFISNTQVGQIQCLCDFAAMIAVGCITKLMIVDPDKMKHALDRT